MAYLGTIAKTPKNTIARTTTLHWWTDSPLSGSRAGKIYGHTKLQNAVVPYALVRLIWQVDGRLLAQTLSNSAGYYEFSGLSLTQNKQYTIQVFKRSGRGFDYTCNAVNYAHLTPSL